MADQQEKETIGRAKQSQGKAKRKKETETDQALNLEGWIMIIDRQGFFGWQVADGRWHAQMEAGWLDTLIRVCFWDPFRGPRSGWD